MLMTPVRGPLAADAPDAARPELIISFHHHPLLCAHDENVVIAWLNCFIIFDHFKVSITSHTFGWTPSIDRFICCVHPSRVIPSLLVRGFPIL